VLRLEGKGHAGSNGGISGDFFAKILVEADKYYKLVDKNIFTEAHISACDALLGGEITVETLYGEVRLEFEAGAEDGQ